jgi:hypothetical protein
LAAVADVSCCRSTSCVTASLVAARGTASAAAKSAAQVLACVQYFKTFSEKLGYFSPKGGRDIQKIMSSNFQYLHGNMILEKILSDYWFFLPILV